jgi:hypothetical protein
LAGDGLFDDIFNLLNRNRFKELLENQKISPFISQGKGELASEGRFDPNTLGEKSPSIMVLLGIPFPDRHLERRIRSLQVIVIDQGRVAGRCSRCRKHISSGID